MSTKKRFEFIRDGIIERISDDVMIKISVLTSTRAEYGLLAPLIKKMMREPEIDVKVIVTGAHLSPEFGLTYKDIEKDGVKIYKKIEMLLSSDTPASISKSMGLAMLGAADYFAENEVDSLLVLGDRYEIMAFCCAAMNAKVPIIHLHGGELTEGAVDEAIRHAITKMSYLHFTSTEGYRQRVIQLGEAPDRVYNVGAMGVENAKSIPLMDKEELELSLGINLENKYAILTFHPVTLEDNTSIRQTKELISALDMTENIHFIVTKANADVDGRVINMMFEEYAERNPNIHIFSSLGTRRYLSAVKYAEFVIGNSSSGIIEVPSFEIPTINIGDRQRGRIQASSVINCKPECEEIITAIRKVQSKEFKESLEHMDNPYEKDKTSDRIIEVIKEKISHNKYGLKKQFYDINFSCEENFGLE